MYNRLNKFRSFLSHVTRSIPSCMHAARYGKKIREKKDADTRKKDADMAKKDADIHARTLCAPNRV
jgi:hypothetical protein